MSFLRVLPVLALAIPLLLAACARDDGPQPEAEPPEERIFRFVEFGPRARFELGEPLGDHARLVTREGPNLYRLRDDAISGAEAIVVETDDGGIVRSIRFAYGAGVAWQDMLTYYTDQFGPPQDADANGAVWRDDRTAFSLRRDDGALHAAGAEMRDLDATP